MYEETIRAYYGTGVSLGRAVCIYVDSHPAFLPQFLRGTSIPLPTRRRRRLSQKVLKKEKGALEAYLNFPLQRLVKIPARTPEGRGCRYEQAGSIDTTMRKLASLVDEMEKLLKQTKKS